MNLIDLFSGCGGMSFGFESVGFQTLLGIDNNDLALETFKNNHPRASVECCDISTAKPSSILKLHNIEKIDGIIGGPPCQGFSISGKRDPNDPRNKLYQNYMEYVKMLRPAFFVMENVPNLASMEDGKILASIVSDFGKLGYRVNHKILLASDFGVPQNRRRIIIVGIKNGKHDFNFPNPLKNQKVTTWDALSDLPEFDVIDGAKYNKKAISAYQEIMRINSFGIWNHETIKHSESTIATISLVPDGGNYKSLPEELWNTRKVNIAWTRMNSKLPSFTIDTGHNHHFHYKWNRVPTARESARIQSFPDTFHFVGKKADHLRQIGNAVPPILAKAIAASILEAI
jgi:DNA (cytosine-5)-methyltransferase 1